MSSITLQVITNQQTSRGAEHSSHWSTSRSRPSRLPMIYMAVFHVPVFHPKFRTYHGIYCKYAEKLAELRLISRPQ